MEKYSFFNIDMGLDIIPDSTVRKFGAGEFLAIGNNNDYYRKVHDLMKKVSDLRSLVEGSAVEAAERFEDEAINYTKLFQWLFEYGQCPVLVRYSRDMSKSFLTPVDPRFVRTNEDETKYAYSEQEGFRQKIVYDRWVPGMANGMLMIKLNELEAPYALPIWSSAMREVETLGSAAEYHANELKNGFVGSTMLTFLNGQPSSEDKETIERLVNDKFAGSRNAGKILVNFADDMEHSVQVQNLSTDDTSSRYLNLVKYCQQSLFTAFHATPLLFGIQSDLATGFSDIEYAGAYDLYQKFCITPVCKIVAKALREFDIKFVPYERLITNKEIEG